MESRLAAAAAAMAWALAASASMTSAEGAWVAALFRKPSVAISAGRVYWSRGSVSFGNRSRIVFVYSAVVSRASGAGPGSIPAFAQAFDGAVDVPPAPGTPAEPLDVPPAPV